MTFWWSLKLCTIGGGFGLLLLPTGPHLVLWAFVNFIETKGWNSLGNVEDCCPSDQNVFLTPTIKDFPSIIWEASGKVDEYFSQLCHFFPSFTNLKSMFYCIRPLLLDLCWVNFWLTCQTIESLFVFFSFLLNYFIFVFVSIWTTVVLGACRDLNVKSSSR